jgi:hypothetical protein
MKYYSFLFLIALIVCNDIDNLMLMIEKSSEISHYSNKLRETHMTNISKMQNFISSFVQLKTNKDSGVKEQLAKYFANIENDVNILNNE